MEKRSAVVFGATGMVGMELVKRLCERNEYVSVTAIGRRAVEWEHPKLQQIVHSLDELTESDIRFAHDVFCCLGTTKKKAGSKEQFEKVDFEYPLQIASIAKNLHIAHFIVISAMGANESANIHYSKVKGQLEQELQKLELPRLSIIRPSLLVGSRQEFRFGEKMGEQVLKVVNPILIGGLKKYRSIKASQVADAMITIALKKDKSPMKVYTSNQLLAMKLPPQPEKKEETFVDLETTFNWNKVNGLDELVDEEVVINRSKIKSIDEDEV